MNWRRVKPDADVQKILNLLQREYFPGHPQAKIDAYRYNSACIQIRIIDEAFAGQRRKERLERIWKILHEHLPEKVLTNIGLLLLLAPEETADSPTNREFEDPTPTPGSIGWRSNGRANRRRIKSKASQPKA